MPTVLTDEWARAAWRWMSDALGIGTADREQWSGERECIRKKADAGMIR